MFLRFIDSFFVNDRASTFSRELESHILYKKDAYNHGFLKTKKGSSR